MVEAISNLWKRVAQKQGFVGIQVKDSKLVMECCRYVGEKLLKAPFKGPFY
jgi:hypothetical protein